MDRNTKTILSSLLVALLSGPGAPVLGRAGDRITGKARTIRTGAADFGLAVNVSQRPGADVAGSAQYTRRHEDGSALIVSLEARCHFVAADGMDAEVAGPATVHENTVEEGVDDWFVVAIQDRGASGDRVRAGFTSPGYGCDGSFLSGCSASGCPGVVIDGDFRVESDD